MKEYERRSGVRVNVVHDTEETKSTGLANRLLAEKARPQADVFWSNEPVRTLVLKSRAVLAPYESPEAQGIAGTFKDPAGYWTGFSARLRVIVEIRVPGSDGSSGCRRTPGTCSFVRFDGKRYRTMMVRSAECPAA